MKKILLISLLSLVAFSSYAQRVFTGPIVGGGSGGGSGSATNDPPVFSMRLGTAADEFTTIVKTNVIVYSGASVATNMTGTTIATGHSGWYNIFSRVSYKSATNGTFSLVIQTNSSEASSLTVQDHYSGAASGVGHTTNTLVTFGTLYLVAGDTVQGLLVINTNTAGSLGMYNRVLFIQKIASQGSGSAGSVETQYHFDTTQFETNSSGRVNIKVDSLVTNLIARNFTNLAHTELRSTTKATNGTLIFGNVGFPISFGESTANFSLFTNNYTTYQNGSFNMNRAGQVVDIDNTAYVRIGSGSIIQMDGGASLEADYLTASRALVVNAQGTITNASGTPDGTKFLRDDNTYAVPPGGSSTGIFNSGLTNTFNVSPWVNGIAVGSSLVLINGTNGAYNVNATTNVLVALTNMLAGVMYEVEYINTNNSVITLSNSAAIIWPQGSAINPYTNGTSKFTYWIDGFGRTNAIASSLEQSLVFGNGLRADTNATSTTITLTTGYYTPTVVTGTGAANTNFVLVMPTNTETVINGFTNVLIAAIYGTEVGKSYYWNTIVTNISGTDRTIHFSAVTNRFRFSGVYGTNPPTVITNNTGLMLSGRSEGTNTTVGYSYFAAPF